VGAVTILRTPTDIFPRSTSQCIVTPAERAYNTSVSDIEHVESQSMPGVAVVKVFFNPDTQIDSAIAEVIAEVTAASQQLLRYRLARRRSGVLLCEHVPRNCWRV
jgi:multidrug efflux pump subunit AcrB